MVNQVVVLIQVGLFRAGNGESTKSARKLGNGFLQLVALWVALIGVPDVFLFCLSVAEVSDRTASLLSNLNDEGIIIKSKYDFITSLISCLPLELLEHHWHADVSFSVSEN